MVYIIKHKNHACSSIEGIEDVQAKISKKSAPAPSYQSDHPVQDKGHGGVVGAIEKGRDTIVLPAAESLFQLL